MASANRKNADIHYRYFDQLTMKNNLQIEKAIRDGMNYTMKSGTIVKDRVENRIMIRQGKDNLLVNQYAENANFLFGDLVLFTPGETQALLNSGQFSKPMVDIAQQLAPQDMEYIKSMIYWSVFGDHVFIIQSHSLRVSDFEEYLTWFFNQQTNQPLNNGAEVILESKFDSAAVGGDLNNIEKIIIGGTAKGTAIKTPESQLPSGSKPLTMVQHGTIKEGKKTEDVGLVRRLLSALFNDDNAKVDRVLNSIPEGTDMNVDVSIGYKRAPKNSDRTPLKSVSQHLNDIPDAKMRIETKDGTIKDGSIRLKHPVSILTLEGGTLLNPTDVQRAMLEAYRYFVDNGKISV